MSCLLYTSTIFKERYVGVDAESGTALPDLNKIADSYGIEYRSATTLKELDKVMEDIIGKKNAVMVDVKCWKEEFNPIAKAQVRMKDGRRVAMPLEDMAPFMSREEFKKEMIIKPIIWWEE